MKTLYNIVTLILFSCSFTWAQNVEFEKANFPDKKDLLKEARKSLDEGKDAFELGMKEYNYVLELYVNEHKYFPVSRKEYQRAGDIYFKQAQPFLMKAQEFNPNNAYLNYMLGVINFNLNPQSDNAVRYLEKSLSLNDPKLPEELTYFLGWACQFQLKWDDAIKYYQMQLAILNKDVKGNFAAIEDVNKKIEECKIGKIEMANPQRVFVDNLGSNINTSYPEYSAFITADESMMVLTARRENSTGGKMDPEDNYPCEDLYQSFKVNGKWTPVQNFGPIVNSDEHDATAGLSSDGTTMFVFKSKERVMAEIFM
jgi:tetratricopeptide (TPR) repeat protein